MCSPFCPSKHRAEGQASLGLSAWRAEGQPLPTSPCGFLECQTPLCKQATPKSPVFSCKPTSSYLFSPDSPTPARRFSRADTYQNSMFPLHRHTHMHTHTYTHTCAHSSASTSDPTHSWTLPQCAPSVLSCPSFKPLHPTPTQRLLSQRPLCQGPSIWEGRKAGHCTVHPAPLESSVIEDSLMRLLSSNKSSRVPVHKPMQSGWRNKGEQDSLCSIQNGRVIIAVQMASGEERNEFQLEKYSFEPGIGGQEEF